MSDGRGSELASAVGHDHPGLSKTARIAARRDSWPTPTVTDATRSGDRNGIPAHVLASPTPVAGHNVSLQHAVRLWPTPKATQGGPDFARARASLPLVESWDPDSLWPTPRASEWKGTGPLGSKSHEHRLDRHYLDATVQEVGQETGPLNPDWVEWLMGFPIGWTDLEVDEPVVLPGDPWPPDPSPGIPRMARDVVRRKQRLMQLGNAVVPQIPEILGHELRELLETVEEED